MMNKQIEIRPDGSVRVNEKRFEYDAVLPFPVRFLRAFEGISVNTTVVMPMRLRRIYVMPLIASHVRCECVSVAGHEVFHAKEGAVPGAMFVEDLDTFDEFLERGAEVEVTFYNQSAVAIELVFTGLGRRDLAKRGEEDCSRQIGRREVER